MRKDEPQPEHRAHWDRVAELGCILSGQPPQISHCHGGSISRDLGPKFRPGMAQRQNHWLVLPLAEKFHIELDRGNADYWEHRYGKQTELLEEVSYRLGYDVFERAGVVGYEFVFLDQPRSAVS